MGDPRPKVTLYCVKIFLPVFKPSTYHCYFFRLHHYEC